MMDEAGPDLKVSKDQLAKIITRRWFHCTWTVCVLKRYFNEDEVKASVLPPVTFAPH